MGRLKKTIIVLTALVFLFLALLVALELALPRLVNLEAVRHAVLSAVQSHVDCEASYERVEISLLPRPHVTVRKLSLVRQGGFTASVEAARMMVDALPLFRGQLRASKVHLLEPRLTVLEQAEAPAMSPDRVGERESLTYTGMRRSFLAFLAPALTFPSGLTVTAEDGSVVVHLESDVIARFDQISAQMDRRGAEARLAYTCRSNLWHSVTSESFFDVETFKGRSSTQIKGLNADMLSRILTPEPRASFPEHDVDVAVEIVSAGPANLDLSFQATASRLAIQVREKRAVLNGADLTGSIVLRPDGFRIILESLRLESPAVTAVGSLLFDPASSRVTVDLQGSNVDAGGVRECALALAGDSRGVVETFEVVKGGTIPEIHVQVREKTLEEAARLENVSIRGSMVDGRLYIEPADLELEGASGDAVIEQGVLEGRNLQARTGETTGRDGSLTLALKKDATGDGPFHLAIDVDADLSRLPAVLMHSVKDPELIGELNRMSEIRGRAAGRLTLGERIKEVKTRVEARTFSIQGHYDRAPFPIALRGSSLTFSDKAVTIGDLEGNLGESSWGPLDITVDWGASSRIEIHSDSPAHIAADQIFPWLTSFERVRRGLADIRGLKGTIALESARLEGPLYQPDKWSYEVKGSFKEGILESPFFPGPVAVGATNLTGVPGVLTLTDCQARLLDASVNMTAALRTQGGLSGSELTFSDAAVGPKVSEWIVDLIKLPPEFRPRPPVSLRKARLTWERGGRVAFRGDLVKAGGLEARIEFQQAGDQWALNRLTVKDPLSDAELKVTVRERDFDLAFRGSLEGKTLEELLEKNELLKGGVSGNIRINVLMNDPVKSTANGVLDLNGFHSLWKFKAPVAIDQARFEALGDRLSIQSLDLVFEGNRLRLAGSLSFAPHGLSMEMSVSSDDVAWKGEELTEPVQGHDDGSGATVRESASDDFLSPKLMGLALAGLVKVSFDRFAYGSLVFAPFKADVHVEPGLLRIQATEAKLCGVSFPGELRVDRSKVSLVAWPTAVSEPLEESIVCLGGKKAIIDGVFSLKGELRAEGPGKDLARSLGGNLELQAKDGRIYRFELISKIFSVINVTEIFRGQLPDLLNDGCGYDSIVAKATIEEGGLTLEEAVVDSRCMKMVWSGTVDLPTWQLDLVVLLAPLRTFEKIIGYVPLIGRMFDGVLSVPVKVSGDLSDPSIVPMSPSAVGSKILGIMKQVLQAPFKVVSPLF